ncbi:MAG TPA: hypothetical protein VF086_09575 [Propionibacteriaceae bacterium]
MVIARERLEPAEAARAMARARWGRTRTDRLLTELSVRRADLEPDQLEQLRALAGAGTTKGT